LENIQFVWVQYSTAWPIYFEVLALQSPGMPRRGVSSPVVLMTMILLIMTFLPFCLAAGGGEGASAGPGTDFLTYLITKAVLLMW